MQSEASHLEAANSRGKGLLKIVLSVAVLAQLLCVALAPNQNAYLRARFAHVIDPYVGALGLGATWSFFAPEPGPPPVFIEYELYDKDGKMLQKNSWPERGQHFLFHDRALRRGAIAQFILLHPEFGASMLIPYLCRHNPLANSVQLWSVVYRIPKLQDVAEGKLKIGDETEPERKSITLDFCQEDK